MVTIYALKSARTQKIYVGMTTNIGKRLDEHNAGKSKFTSSFVPWFVIYQEVAPDFIQGGIREKYLKSTAGKKFIKKILEESRTWYKKPLKFERFFVPRKDAKQEQGAKHCDLLEKTSVNSVVYVFSKGKAQALGPQ